MNRKKIQTRHQLSRESREPRQWWVIPAALITTLLALPVNAGITIPDDPLTTASRVAPNILFILDDSGSMAFDYMPDSVPATSNINVAMRAYTRNTLSYNPAVTYLPWMKADGNRMTDGTSYSDAFGSFNLVGGTKINLGSDLSCKSFNYNYNATTDEPIGIDSHGNPNGTMVCGGLNTFYVPKDPTNTSAAYLANGNNYYFYKILPSGSGIVRSGTFGTITKSSPTTRIVSPGSGSLGNDNVLTHALETIASGLHLEVRITSTNNRSKTYEVKSPSGGIVCRGAFTNNDARICAVNSTAAGIYTVRVWRNTNNTADYSLSAESFTSSDRCGFGVATGGTTARDWIGCTSAIPSARSLPDELTNYATWFSYHRTRMKVAKAGTSDAFKSQGNKVRVGFRTIWQRAANHTYPIPVSDGNEGRFVNNPDDPNTPANEATTTRNTWYSRMQAAIGSNSTPLHGALENAGKYFGSTDAAGPYGPESGASQYSCRQNFTIMTTDGYWNNAANYDGGSIASGGGVGEQDDNNGATYTDPKGNSGGYTASTPYRSADSNTLADVAMKYWKTDLRALTNNVPTTSSDPAFWQHMVTFGISIGLAGNTGYQSVGAVPTNFNAWPNPNDAENADRIDDLLHAAVNGHGAFVSAINPTEFTAGLTQALATIAQRTSSYSNVATNSTSLNTGAQVFSASYTSGLWSGSVTARAVTRAGVSGTVTWTSTIPTWSSRKILTSTGSAGAIFPTATQIASLARGGGPADFGPITGAQNADYIKGDQSKEESQINGLLRNRSSVLGDIVGSSPAFVKDTGTLYVGANDGMMHAFNAATGAEVFAYVPSIINFNYLSTLSRGDYEHKFFVDGPIAVTNRLLTPGKNLLVGTLGKGGKGLYSLDVTTPGSFGVSDVEWERAETPNNNMGLVQGAPILAAVRNGSPTNAVVLGNGVNSTNEKAVLIVLDIATGAVIREIDTLAGSAAAPNGLSAPTGIYAADGKTLIYAYAGDLLGNVWKFDLTSSSPSAWSVKKLFNATKSVPQPITSAVTVAVDPMTNKRWVFFGTGSFMTIGDADDKTASAQSMYGFIDENQATAYGRGNLTQRGMTVAGSFRSFDAKASLPSASKGWYVDLPGAGERIVQDAQISSTFLITASMIPDGDACEASGTGYINAIDAFTGTSGGTSFFDLDGDGVTDDTGSGGNPVGSANLGVGMPTRPILLPGQIVVGGTGDGTAAGLGGSNSIGMQWNRVSWREIRQD